jgi:asparagine synthase (glutamine-hydrolysing)
MCGIAGFIDQGQGDEQAAELIDEMCRVIRHRGPDDQGTWVEAGVALGMRRLSIIDVAGGHQPIFNEDGSIGVVFNGEIYNYQELQVQLRARGHRFRTDADTEVIVHAYEEYGDDCAQHLRGMFVFALWDGRRERLLAARDRFGKKPFNYYWDGTRLIFGSEIKSILQAGIRRDINPIALDEYLAYGYVPSPLTIFQDVYKLPAAHILTYEQGQVKTRRYWELSFAPTCGDDEETAIERTRALLKEAVRIRLMSEVPLGAFLSGGIDSSIVVGLMSEEMSQPVKTFSIGFAEDGYNELPYARQVAEQFGTEHHEYLVEPKLIEVLPELVWAYDEPFADSSMLPTYYVSKLAREQVTVALSGDGGDEIFGGYRNYRYEAILAALPGPARLAGGLLGPLLPDRLRAKTRVSGMNRDLASRAVDMNLHFATVSRDRLYTPGFYCQVEDHDPRRRQLDLFAGTESLNAIARLQKADVEMWLPDDILTKVDKASMLNSLETRAPLLDQELAAYVASLPANVRTRAGTLKYLLKRVAGTILPAEVMQRRKQGFAMPVEDWFRCELAAYSRELLDSPRLYGRGIFQPAAIRGLLDEHARASRARTDRQIWALVCLELWFQTYLDAPVVDSLARAGAGAVTA